jgi:hypothetical protein
MKRLAVAAVLFITACKKENDTPAFKPQGFWRGNAYLYHAAILNRPNGTSRLYFVIPGTDTSKAQTKLEGTHSMNQGKFLAVFNDVSDTLLFESTTTSPTLLSGLILSTTLGQAVPFNFNKQ